MHRKHLATGIVASLAIFASCGGTGTRPPPPDAGGGGSLADPCAESMALKLQVIEDFEGPNAANMYTNSDVSDHPTLFETDAGIPCTTSDPPIGDNALPNPPDPMKACDAIPKVPTTALDSPLCGTSKRAMHIKAGGYTAWGIVIGKNPINNSPDTGCATNPDNPNFCDATQWDGIAFWARRGSDDVGRSIFFAVADPDTYDLPAGATLDPGAKYFTNGSAGNCGDACDSTGKCGSVCTLGAPQPMEGEACTNQGQWCKIDDTNHTACVLGNENLTTSCSNYVAASTDPFIGKYESEAAGSPSRLCCTDAKEPCTQCNCTASGWHCGECPATAPSGSCTSEGQVCTYPLPRIPASECVAEKANTNNNVCRCNGGSWQCSSISAALNSCDRYGAGVGLELDWRFFKIPFSSMRQRGFGKGTTGLDTKRLIELAFYMDAGGSSGVGEPNGNWDVWLDDISFYKNQ